MTYQYWEFRVPGMFNFLWWYRRKLVPENCLGTGIGKIWYRKKVSEAVTKQNWYQKKVSELVSENFGTGKSTGIGIKNIWYRKKVSVSVSFDILGTVTHWLRVRRA